MQLQIKKGSCSSGFVGLFYLCLLLLVGVSVPNSFAENVSSAAAFETELDVKGRVADLNERKVAIDSLKVKLAAAKTTEERTAAIEEFQSKSQAVLSRRNLPTTEQKTAEVKIAELKAQAQGNPELLARLSALDARLKGFAALKSKLAEAQMATGEQKERLLDDVRSEQAKLSQVRQAEVSARVQEAKIGEDVKALPPEMAALKAKSEARKREVEQLKESLSTASPEERAKLLDDWRKKRQAETAELRSQMDRVQ